jgi:hypothetical protein
MGIWDKLVTAVSKVNDYSGEKVEEVNKYKEEYSRLNDKELMNKYKQNSGFRQFAIAKLLDERGYKKDSDNKWHKR